MNRSLLVERKEKGTEGTGMVSGQLLSIYYMPGPVLGAEDTQVSTRAVICLWQVRRRRILSHTQVNGTTGKREVPRGRASGSLT